MKAKGTSNNTAPGSKMKVAVVQLSSAAPRVRVLDRARVVKAARRALGRASRRASAATAALVSTLHRAGAPARPALLVLATAGALACRSGDVNEPAPAPPPAAGGAHSAARTVNKANDGYRPPAPAPWHIPVGPKLEIMPGKGLGPIRFGAHVDTIERLIGEPCEEKRDEAGKQLCRYSAQAVDFVLENGGVTEMRAHRLGRPFKDGGKPDYGIFNGSFLNGLAFGMVPNAARELAGAPKNVRPITGDNPFHTVEVYEYDGFRLEFDRVSPESVVLGGVVLDAPKS